MIGGKTRSRHLFCFCAWMSGALLGLWAPNLSWAQTDLSKMLNPSGVYQSLIAPQTHQPFYESFPSVLLDPSQNTKPPLPKFSQWEWHQLRTNPGFASSFTNPRDQFLKEFPHFGDWSFASNHTHPLIQGWVDQIFSFYMEKPMIQQILCGLFLAPFPFHFFGGSSLETAAHLSETCGHSSMGQFDWHHHFTKEYVFLFAPTSEEYPRPTTELPLDSWTDLTNVTYLVVTPQTQFHDLALMLFHELSIQSDAKNDILPTTYQMTTNIQPNQDEIDLLFLSNSPLINLSFAIHRATYAEAILMEEWLPSDKKGKFRAYSDRTDCPTEFRRIFQQVKTLAKNAATSSSAPSSAPKAGTRILEILRGGSQSLFDGSPNPRTDAIMKAKGLTSEDEVADYLLNPNKRIRVVSGFFRDQSESFCNYMRVPLLSPYRRHTINSHGPRPPVTGGAYSEDRSQFLRLFQEATQTYFDRLDGWPHTPPPLHPKRASEPFSETAP